MELTEMIINKTKGLALLIPLIMLPVYLLFYAYRPVEVVAVYHDKNYVDVIVKNFPSGDKDKIVWWLENNKLLTERTSFSMPPSDSHYFITLWDYGDGFKAKTDDDMLCFTQIKSDINCIDKIALLIVSNNYVGDVFFTVDNARYRLADDKIIKIEDW
ncbi:DUF943 family protein [Siccibacter colletis]|uniref:DUF943 family protein n=1 Tax=Siccibacter colletis TaxID=1505757 RepID=UPI0028BF4E3C|nr:DUF943 family protein [Siccibacter colletis]WNN47715.1 DUF943 family protein [Siccibacter colletis]